MSPEVPEAPAVAAVPGTESCLILVTSHLGSAPLVESVTTEARRRVMASPMLGGFTDLKFMHLGPQPGRGGDQSQALARISSQMLVPRPGVGRSFFAVAIIDRSATVAEAVLRDCAKSPFLSELPLRLLGIASQEDRRKSAVPLGTKMLVSPHNAWRGAELVDLIRRYADSLLDEFARGQHRGITPSELAGIRDRYDGHAARERAVIPRTGVATTGGYPVLQTTGGLAAAPDTGVPTGGFPAIAATTPPAQDALDPAVTPRPYQAGPPQPAPGPQARSLPASAPGTVQPGSPLARLPAQPAMPAGGGQAAAPASGDAPASPGRVPRFARRLIPDVRWRRAHATGEAGAPGPDPTRSGIAYLLLTGEPDSGDQAAWVRSRAMILEVDKKLAALPEVSCHVRVLSGNEDELRGEMRAAGQLTKRDVRGAVADLDFAGVLDEVRRIVNRDRSRWPALALPLGQPAVVIFAPEPPLADSRSVRAFRALAQEARIAWVVPKAAVQLLSEELMDGGQVLSDYESQADDAAALLGPALLMRSSPED